MVQTVICKVNNCVYNSQHGFCLKKVVCISNTNGMCNWLQKHPKDYFNIEVEDFTKNTWKGDAETADTQKLITQVPANNNVQQNSN